MGAALPCSSPCCPPALLPAHPLPSTLQQEQAEQYQLAVFDSSDDKAAALLKEGVALNELPLPYPPLHMAAAAGLLSTVQALLQPPCSLQPDSPTHWWATPLHNAAYYGRQSVAKALLDAEASVLASGGCCFRDRRGTALDVARRTKQPADLLRMLEVGVWLTNAVGGSGGLRGVLGLGALQKGIARGIARGIGMIDFLHADMPTHSCCVVTGSCREGDGDCR